MTTGPVGSGETASASWHRDLVEHAGGFFFVYRTDPDPCLEFVSDTIQDLTGYSPGELVSNPHLIPGLVDAREAERVSSRLDADPGVETNVEFHWTHRSGRTVWARHQLRRRQRADGSTVIEGIGYDVSALRVAEQALEASAAAALEQEARLRATIDAMIDPHILCRPIRDAGGRIVDFEYVDANKAACRHNRLSLDELIGRRMLDLFPGQEAAGFIDRYARTVDEGEPLVLDAVRYADEMQGRQDRMFDIRGVRVGDALSLTWRDVSDREQAAKRLARSEQRFRLAMLSAPTGMAVVDLDRRFVEVNPALCRMLERDQDWLLAHRVPDVLSAEDDKEDLRMRAEVLSGRTEACTGTLRMSTASGDLLVVEHSIGLLRDERGTPLSYVSQVVDVTERQQAQERLRYLATHDVLTTVANRGELMRRMGQVMTRTPRTGTIPGVLFIDLDDLKTVNDTLGHVAGDRVLVEFADRVRTVLRHDDVVARVGGDEFIVLLLGLHDIGDAEAVAAKIHGALVPPVTVEGATLTMSASIGVAIARPGEGADALIARADVSLYRAKQTGRNRTVSDTTT